MSLTVNGKTIETDEEGFLLDHEQWDDDVMQALIAAHEAAGHKKVTEEGIKLIRYVRDFYEDNLRHPTMHEMVKQHAREEGEKFLDAESYKRHLYDLFPHGPVVMLSKLAGLPAPIQDVES